MLLLGAAAVVGLLAGLILDVLTVWLQAFGPSAGAPDAAWSFRGNGALIVPFGLGPAVLAGGWTALVLHGRPGARWLQRGLAAGLVGVALVLLSALLTMVGGMTGAALAQPVLLVNLVWALIAPVAAAFRAGGQRQTASVLHLLAGGLYATAVIASYIVGGRILPPVG